MPHHRARHTPLGRWEVMRRVVEEGETFAQAAAWANVSKSTVWEWVRRWRQATPEDRASLACLAERSSRPHRSPARLPAEEEQRICELRRRTGWSPRRIADEVGRPHSTVHQVLRRGDCSRRPAPERPAVVRYEWPCPGNLLHMDVKKFGKFTEPGHAVTGDRTQRSRRVGWEYVHSIVDDCSRLAYSEIHDDETAATVTAFTRRALDRFLELGIVAERLMTDNAFAYTKNKTLRELLATARSTTSRPGPTRHAPTARSSATSRRCNASGPTRWSTPQARPVGPRCHTGCATTTSGAPTAPSPTALPSTAFGRSPGSTASRPRRWLPEGLEVQRRGQRRPRRTLVVPRSGSRSLLVGLLAFEWLVGGVNRRGCGAFSPRCAVRELRAR